MDAGVEKIYFGRVTDLLGKGGCAGELMHIRLELLHNGRTIQRAVKGTVFVGDYIEILECEREHRKPGGKR